MAPGERGVVFTNNDQAYRTALAGQASGRRRGHGGRQPPASRWRPHRGGPTRRHPDPCRQRGVRGRVHRRRPGDRSGARRCFPGRHEPAAARNAVCPATMSRCPAATTPPSICGATMAASFVTTRSFTPIGPTAITTASGQWAPPTGPSIARRRWPKARLPASRRRRGRSVARRSRTSSSRRRNRAARVPSSRSGSLRPAAIITTAHKHFVDFQNDVTVADLELAQREGYSSVEHTKRYTTWGMASDQGKTSSILGLGILSEATGRPIPEIGVTTFRPPFTPMTFGTVAGAQKGPLFLPVRQTPVHDWHVAQRSNLRADWPLAARLLLSKGRRGQGSGDRSRDPGGAPRRRPARCLDPRQDRDQRQGRRQPSSTASTPTASRP